MKNTSHLNTHSSRRYKLDTEKNNQIIVEEINNKELDSFWKTLNEIKILF